MSEPATFVWPLDNIIVVDGDTVRAWVDMGCGMWKLGHDRKGEPIRLAGLNAPEKKAPTLMESRAAKAWLKERIEGKRVRVVSHDNPEKWRRILGTLWVEGDMVSINEQMLAAGHAKPYDGGHKD